MPTDAGEMKEELHTVDATQREPSAEPGLTIEQFKEMFKATTNDLLKHFREETESRLNYDPSGDQNAEKVGK